MSTMVRVIYLVEDGQAGVAVNRSGTVQRPPGLPLRSLLGRDARVVSTMLGRLIPHCAPIALLCPHPATAASM